MRQCKIGLIQKSQNCKKGAACTFKHDPQKSGTGLGNERFNVEERPADWMQRRFASEAATSGSPKAFTAQAGADASQKYIPPHMRLRREEESAHGGDDGRGDGRGSSDGGRNRGDDWMQRRLASEAATSGSPKASTVQAGADAPQKYIPQRMRLRREEETPRGGDDGATSVKSAASSSALSAASTANPSALSAASTSAASSRGFNPRKECIY